MCRDAVSFEAPPVHTRAATNSLHLGVVGVGEVGAHLASALVTAGHHVVTTDVDTEGAAARLAATPRGGAALPVGIADLARTDGVISCVHPATALGVAAAMPVTRGAHYLDVNSIAPDQKQALAATLAQKGWRDVSDGTIGGGGFRLPQGPVFYLAGLGARRWATILATAGYETEVLGDAADDLGRASMLKMLRSAFTKGYEGLIVESLLAARAAGLLDAVVDSIGRSFDGLTFREIAESLVAGHVQHGHRRIGEIESVRHTFATNHLATRTPMLDATLERFLVDVTASRAARSDTTPEHGLDPALAVMAGLTRDGEGTT